MKEDELVKSRDKLDVIKVQIANVFKSRASSEPDSDPFLVHIDKQITLKTKELECPVCFCVAQPPILR